MPLLEAWEHLRTQTYTKEALHCVSCQSLHQASREALLCVRLDMSSPGVLINCSLCRSPSLPLNLSFYRTYFIGCLKQRGKITGDFFRQGSFVRIAHFVHKGNSKCFTEINKEEKNYILLRKVLLFSLIHYPVPANIGTAVS